MVTLRVKETIHVIAITIRSTILKTDMLKIKSIGREDIIILVSYSLLPSPITISSTDFGTQNY